MESSINEEIPSRKSTRFFKFTGKCIKRIFLLMWKIIKTILYVISSIFRHKLFKKMCSKFIEIISYTLKKIYGLLPESHSDKIFVITGVLMTCRYIWVQAKWIGIRVFWIFYFQLYSSYCLTAHDIDLDLC